ncbi:hypothetical protein [Streptomyces sp. NPDC055506]
MAVECLDTEHAWELVLVPDGVGTSVHDYVAAAGLAYAAFDFTEDKDGLWWFLECNQSGQYGFIELETGQPISEAVALWLSRRDDRCGHRRFRSARATAPGTCSCAPAAKATAQSWLP